MSVTMSVCPSGSDLLFGPRVNAACRNLDFTIFFEEAILTCMPCVLFIILSPWCIISSLRQHARFSLSSKTLAIKMLAFSVLLACYLALLALHIQDQRFTTDFSITADLLCIVATCIALCLSILEHQRRPRPSTQLTLYLSASVVSNAIEARTIWLLHHKSSVLVVKTVILATTVITLLSVSAKNDARSFEQNTNYTAEQLSGIWSRTLFLWIIPILQTGYSRIINLPDLPTLSRGLESKRSHDILNSTWSKYDRHAHYTLLYATFHAYLPSFLHPIIPRLCLTVFTFLQPLLIKTTLDYLDQGYRDRAYGKGLVGAWAVVYAGMAVSNSMYQYQNLRFVSKLRGGLVALIYQHLLRIRVYDSGNVTAVALMSTDIDRLVNGVQMLHEVWGSLLNIAIAAWLLGRELSVACLAPILLVATFIGLTSKISNPARIAQMRWITKVQERLQITSTMLKDVKGVKMLGFLEVMSDIIQTLRMNEIKISKEYRKILTSMLLLSLTPINLAPVLTFAVYTVIALYWQNQSLLTAQAFTSVSLIALLTTPVIIFAQTLPNVVQCLGMFNRIQDYCNYDIEVESKDDIALDDSRQSLLDRRVSPTASNMAKHSLTPEDRHISLYDKSFSWKKNTAPVLKHMNVRICRGHVTVIAGPVSSGKSALLNCFLGEISSQRSPGDSVASHQLMKPTAYCAQSPWLENGTIRQNVVGCSDYEEQWYARVISACGLDLDIDHLERGDQTHVGSDGLNLSGGQKQRIALARAVYSRHEMTVLDDVFSGMDAHTSQHVSRCLLGRNGLLRGADRTVIVATHNRRIMALADEIIVLTDGSIIETGSPAALLTADEYNNDLASKVLSDQEATEESHQGERMPHNSTVSRTSREAGHDEVPDAPSDSRRRKGDLSIYRYYVARAGYGLVCLYLVFVILWMFCTSFSPVLLKWWSQENSRKPNLRVGMWMSLYAMLGGLGTLSAFIAAWIAFVFVISNTAERLHSDLLRTTIGASFRYLTATDHGEILNRFSQDMELVDMELPMIMVNYTSTIVSCVISAIILAIFSRYLGAAIPFLAVAVYFIQRFYLRTSRQMRLLVIEARAPLYTLFTESAAGAVTIRAFGWQSHYMRKCYDYVNEWQKPVYFQSCIQYWLVLVLDLLVAVIAVALVWIVVTWQDKFSPGSVGVSLVMVMGFNETIARLIQNGTKLESSIGAVSRVMQFVDDVEPEADQNRHAAVPTSWPENGAITYINMSASYGFLDVSALKGISLDVTAGQHIAICGRTGSGKTSLILSLLRMINVQSGQMLIDGIDVSTIDLTVLRRRLNVVPQDTLLLPKTIRFNIDPFDNASDPEITRALERVGLWDRIQERGGMYQELDVAAWSAGQKQLLCLARAMVKKSQILILDEVASSVDAETEAKIQDIIDSEFKDRTVLAVMHRLRHISSYDMVALLDQGELVEYDEPTTLIDRPSQFAALYRSNVS